jgi:hypothetical protein
MTRAVVALPVAPVPARTRLGQFRTGAHYYACRKIVVPRVDESAMEEVDDKAGEPWLSVGWRNGTPGPGATSFWQGAAFASVFARTLAAAGYEPRRLEVEVRRGALGRVELHIIGDVPGMSEADFDSLAQVTLHALRLRKDLAGADELVVVGRLEQGGSATARPSPSRVANAAAAAQGPPTKRPRLPSPLSSAARSLALPRLVTAVVLGLFLGVVGLPRLDISLPDLSKGTQISALAIATPIPPVVATVDNPRPPIVSTARPTLTLPTPTAVPIQRAASAHAGVLFAERFASPLANWPNDPLGTAWFAAGALHLSPRQSGRFVAVGVPFIGTIGDGVVSAQFHKVGGPAGGGYGVIIRDQAGLAERDSRSQAGQYLVVEVGDGGDIGVWRRDELRWIDVVPWTHSYAVRTGEEPNTLVVSTTGEAVRFEVNGEVVALLNYYGLPATGGAGIFVGGDLNEVALEWLRIETL